MNDWMLVKKLPTSVPRKCALDCIAASRLTPSSDGSQERRVRPSNGSMINACDITTSRQPCDGIRLLTWMKWCPGMDRSKCVGVSQRNCPCLERGRFLREHERPDWRRAEHRSVDDDRRGHVDRRRGVVEFHVRVADRHAI